MAMSDEPAAAASCFETALQLVQDSMGPAAPLVLAVRRAMRLLSMQ
jgi:hypothetical protein